MSTCRETEIRIAGKTLYVPSAEICGQTVVITGKWLRVAAVKDEELVAGEIVDDPAAFVKEMRRSAVRADILTFAQKLSESTPKYEYDFEWDNRAVIPITCFDDWWENRLPQETRKNVRRAAKRGVTVRVAEFDDEFVKGVQGIYNETPIRQGRRFWHFGKDFDTVKRETATYLERSEFLGAYFNEELIGFIKIIYVDRIATVIHILAKSQHQDKRPVNAILAKAVELCEKKNISFLLYGKYVYDKNEKSPLTEFKRRNGFEEGPSQRSDGADAWSSGKFVEASAIAILSKSRTHRRSAGKLIPKDQSSIRIMAQIDELFAIDARAREEKPKPERSSPSRSGKRQTVLE
jgi:hypothetical protein